MQVRIVNWRKAYVRTKEDVRLSYVQTFHCTECGARPARPCTVMDGAMARVAGPHNARELAAFTRALAMA